MTDQLDMQVEVEQRAIRRAANDARRRLGLRPRNYDQEETTCAPPPNSANAN